MVTIPAPETVVDLYDRRVELLDRESELSTLRDALRRAGTGRGETIFVCGEAGIGKTTLIRRFLDDVNSAVILEGQCDNLIAPRAFGPFRDMARSSEHLPNEVELSPDRDRLLSTLHDLLSSSLRPTIVVIEDAQWLDDASLDVVRYLTHRMPRLHGLLLVSLRDSDLPQDHPLRVPTTGPSNHLPLRLDLGPLSPEAVAKLAAQSGYDTDLLMAASGGNPFYLSEVLATSADALPPTIRDTVAARAARLSEQGRSAIQVLSVIPNGADPALAQALFGDDPVALEEAEASGLLEATTRRIQFRHELGRRAIEESLSFGRRLACNQQLLKALVAVDADPTMLVHVARAAGDAAQASSYALRTLRDGVAPTSFREIWTLSRIALEYTSGLDQADIVALHLRAARAGQAINRLSDARHHADAAVRLMGDDDDPSPLAAALTLVAALSGALGEYGLARQSLEQALRSLEGQPASVELAVCYSFLSAVAMVLGENDSALDWAEQAIDLGEQHDWSAPLVHALGVRGFVRAGQGDEGGYEDLARARELGATHGPLDRHVTVVYNTAVALLRWARPRQAEALVDEAEHIARSHGLDNFLFLVHVQRALMLIFRGEVEAAEALLNTLLGREETDPGLIGSTAHALLGRIYARRGDERAAGTVERAWNMASATGDAQKIAVAGITRIEYLWLQGDDAGVRSLGHDMLQLAERCGHPRLHAETLRYLMRIGDPAKVCDICPENYRAALSGDFAKSAELWKAAGQPYEQALELVESPTTAVAFEGLRILDRLGATRTADLIRYRLRSQGLSGVPRGPRKASNGGVAVLTDRQREVLRLVGDGLTNQEIADELFVARRTVDNHVSAILTRLGVESRHDAVDEAISLGLHNPG